MKKIIICSFVLLVFINLIPYAKGNEIIEKSDSIIGENQVTVQIVLEITSCNSWVEFKIESDNEGERATGRLCNGGNIISYTFNSCNQNIWMWFDRCDGSGSLQVDVIKNGVSETIISGKFSPHNDGNEVAPTVVILSPDYIKGSGSPRIINSSHEIDYIKCE